MHIVRVRTWRIWKQQYELETHVGKVPNLLKHLIYAHTRYNV